MTCEEFRAFIARNPILAQTTRGERAAIIRHAGNCNPCNNWVMKIHLPTPQNVLLVHAQHNLDCNDPEYLETILKE